MHIPDGYLGPSTWGAAYAAMLPVWAVAARRVGRRLRSSQVPLLAMGAAFVFVVMMFNIPLGPTTGHATGGVLVAVLLGPWAAALAVSVALAIQAFLFGDGGITALGANCFNMAFLMPFAGYWIYRLMSWRSPLSSRRRWLAAALAGYLALNLAAASTAIMLGIQPVLHRDASGQPLYSPFPLSVALPVMAGGHLLVFGWVEAALTGLAVAYLQRAQPELLEASV
jgi:cobalt/nickel transport system permease protein